MKKLYLLVILGMMIFGKSTGQNLIAVQNGGAPTFFLKLDDALSQSHDGDTLFIPGGHWTISSSINKSIHIVGAGHNPDSTMVTFPTVIDGTITLVAGASNGSLTGFRSTSGINFSALIINYTISRVYFPSLDFGNQACSYNTLKENVMGTVTGSSINLSYNMFFNNIIEGNFGRVGNGSYLGYHNIVKNNVFLSINLLVGSYYPALGPMSDAIFENNVFVADSVNAGYGTVFHTTEYATNNYYNNNLFVDRPTTSNYAGYNNIIRQAQKMVFS